MISITYGVAPFIQALSMFFRHAPGWGARNFKLHETGRFDPMLRALNYGLGNSWAMHYIDDVAELYVFVNTDIANNGTASISYRTNHGENAQQWKVHLLAKAKKPEQSKPIALDLLSWLRTFKETQLEAFADSNHQRAAESFLAWDNRKPSICYDIRKEKTKDIHSSEPDWFEKNGAMTEQGDMAETMSNKFAISLRYKTPENLGYCVIVFDVTSSTRNDRYAINVKAPSFMLQNLMGLYQRGLFGKMMRLIGEEQRSKESAPGNAPMSHLLEFTRMQRTRPQAVCVTQPQSCGVVDQSIRPGQVFDIKAIEQNMSREEFITINVDGMDVERNANNFVIYGRN